MRAVTTIAVVGAGIGLLAALAGAPAEAHHAFAAEFDASAPIELQGTVVRMEWVNPHTWIHIDVAEEDGTQARWMIEGGPPSALLRRGFTKRDLLAGTEVFVEGFRSKDGTNKANGRDVTFVDGSKLFLGSSGTGAPLDGRDPTEPRR
ncbi:MAG: hypothetical protein J4F37_12930 [Acidobacteria bacterium]|nr:hypothetical protein [Acidobacteriota bacterium]MCY4661320.1 DUF6152 family protein [Acidobacteriota bacterium]